MDEKSPQTRLHSTPEGCDCAPAPLTPEQVRQMLGEEVARQLGIFAIPDDFLLSVVIPVYNEERTLRECVRRVRAARNVPHGPERHPGEEQRDRAGQHQRQVEQVSRSVSVSRHRMRNATAPVPLPLAFAGEALGRLETGGCA